MYRYFHDYYAPDYKGPLAAAGVAAIAFLAVMFFPGKKPDVPAEGRLATAEDLKRHGYLGEGKLGDGAIFLGLLDERNRYVQLPPIEATRHVLVEAGTGEGKTSTYVMSLAMSAAYHGQGMIAWDQKYGEPSGLVESLAMFRHFHRPVYTYAPYDPDTPRIPLLDMVTDHKSATKLAEALIAPAEDESVDFYRGVERDMFAAVALAISLVARADGRPAKMSEIVRVFNTGDQKYVSEVLQEGARFAKDPANDPWEWGQVIFGDDRRMSRITESMRSLREKLAVFLDDPNVDRATSRGRLGENLSLTTIFEKPSLFYIGLPKTEVASESNKTLMRLLKIWVDNGLYLTAVENHGGELPYLTHYVLDEFQNFGELPRVSEGLALFRSMGVAFHIIIQDRAALRKIYGDEGADEIMGNNTGTKIYYVGGLSDAARDELAQWIGDKTIVEESMMRELSPMHEIEARQTRRLGKKAVYSMEEMQEAEQGTVVARMHYVPYVVYKAALLDDPKHPLHRDWVEISKKVRDYADEWVTAGNEAAGEDQRAPQKNPVVERFLTWVSELANEAAPFRVVKDRDGNIAMIKLLGLPSEALADEWVERQLLFYHSDGWVITRSGVALLDDETLRKIEEASKIHALLKRYESENAVARGVVSGGGYLVIVDEPSRTIFVHVSTKLAAYGRDRQAELMALGVQNPSEWRALLRGRLAYGMLDQRSLEGTYGELYARSEGGVPSAF